MQSERYHLEDIKTWYENETGKNCSAKMAKAILTEFEDGEDCGLDFWTNIENAYKRLEEKRNET